MGAMTYDEFRSGLTFRDVVEEIREEARMKYEQGEYMFWSRSTVLGRWRQRKLEMYSHYLSVTGGRDAA